MDLDDYALNLGRLLANLQSLEFALRAFLANEPENAERLPPGTDVYEFALGATVPVTPFTNYDSLGALLTKFNEAMISKGKPGIDTSIKQLRDALAHGRISAPADNTSLRIIKFSRPQENGVVVEFNEVMSREWLQAQIRRVHGAILLVHQALEA